MLTTSITIVLHVNPCLLAMNVLHVLYHVTEIIVLVYCFITIKEIYDTVLSKPSIKRQNVPRGRLFRTTITGGGGYAAGVAVPAVASATAAAAFSKSLQTRILYPFFVGILLCCSGPCFWA